MRGPDSSCCQRSVGGGMRGETARHSSSNSCNKDRSDRLGAIGPEGHACLKCVLLQWVWQTLQMAKVEDFQL